MLPRWPKMVLDNLLPTAFLLCAVIIVLLVRFSTLPSVAESLWQSPMTQALLRKVATDDMNIFMLKLSILVVAFFLAILFSVFVSCLQVLPLVEIGDIFLSTPQNPLRNYCHDSLEG